MSDFSTITNKSFSMNPVDGGAPDWRTEQSFLDLSFERDRVEYSLRITWPSRATFSALVNDGMDKAHPELFAILTAPTLAFPITIESLDTLCVIQPLLDEIAAMHPGEPEHCRSILEHSGFEDTLWHFYPQPWRSELVRDVDG